LGFQSFRLTEVAADSTVMSSASLTKKQYWGVAISTLWYVDRSSYLGTVIIRPD